MALVFSLEWFQGINFLFELFALISTLLVAFFSYRVFKYTSQRKYFHFALAFFLVAAAFFLKIISSIIVYSGEQQLQTIGAATLTTYNIYYFEWIQSSGFFIARFVMLLAFLLLFIVNFKVRSRVVMLLLMYLVFVSILARDSYLIFHATLFVILLPLAYYYFKNYLKNRKLSSALVLSSFFLMLISHPVFSFVLLYDKLYVAAEFIQSLAFLILLLTILIPGFRK
ncbi:hypothetical protein HYU07_05885 [Candidatus Woesearchaeota archaeon]|nr:hypothetical protein [Candidatus Woesearchaeota archaeon]